LAGLVWTARVSPGLGAAGVAFSGAPDFIAAVALALQTAAQRFLCAAAFVSA
jgi:hypothetical protein